MANIVHYKPSSANLTLLGLLYIAAAVSQMWFWYDHLYLRHWTQVTDLFTAMATDFRVAHVIVVAYHLMFAGIIVYLFYLGCTMVRLSWKAGARIVQTNDHRWQVVKAIAFLCVVFIICFWFVPSMRPEGIVLEMFGYELMGTMMAAYSLFAITKYHEKRY